MGIPLTLALLGHDIPLRDALSKKGNTYWSVMAKKANGERYMARYGVKIPALADSLPDFAEFGDTVLLLEPGFTEKSGNPKVSASESVQVNGKPYTLTVSVSDIGPDPVTGADRWNLVAKVIPQGGGGGSKTVSITDL